MAQDTPGFGYYLTGFPQLGTAVNQGLQSVLQSPPMRAGTGAAKGIFDLINPVPNLQEAYRISNDQGYSALVDKDYWANVFGVGAVAGGGIKAAVLGAKGAITKSPQLINQAGTTLRNWYGGKAGAAVATGFGTVGAYQGLMGTGDNQATPPAQQQPGKYDWVNSIPTSSMIRSWEQTNLAGALMGTNTPTPSLTPSEIEYFAAQQRELRRRAGQASAADKLQTQQAKQEANSQIADLRSFMLTAPQDVAAQTTALGPAAELGYARTVERDVSEKTGDVRQNLADYLARQKLQGSQRGSNVSAGLSDIELAKAAALKDRINQQAEFNANIWR